jgi:hypothetical protein
MATTTVDTSFFVRVSQCSHDIQQALLDLIDEDGLRSMKHTQKAGMLLFESDGVTHYLLNHRLPQLIDRAKPYEQHSDQHKLCVRKFFKIISLLPSSIKFPAPCHYEAPSRLKTLLSHLCDVVSTREVQYGDPLKSRVWDLSKLQDKRIEAFFTLVPTKLLYHTRTSWIELSRRFSITEQKMEFLTSFHINWTYVSVTNKYIDFMQGVSAEFLQTLLLNHIYNENGSFFYVDESLVKAFSKIENQIEAHDKLIIFAQWYPQFSALMLELKAKRIGCQGGPDYKRASTLMNILYMAALVDQKIPIDRELVKSWIPVDLRYWRKLSGYAQTEKELPNRESVVKQRFGGLFTQESELDRSLPYVML